MHSSRGLLPQTPTKGSAEARTLWNPTLLLQRAGTHSYCFVGSEKWNFSFVGGWIGVLILGMGIVADVLCGVLRTYGSGAGFFRGAAPWGSWLKKEKPLGTVCK
ncbi:MAG: hypothetical protein OCD01_15645 [Fibrobacterales bacterium]